MFSSRQRFHFFFFNYFFINVFKTVQKGKKATAKVKGTGTFHDKWFLSPQDQTIRYCKMCVFWSKIPSFSCNYSQTPLDHMDFL